MRSNVDDFMDELIKELDEYKEEELPSIKRRWIHTINTSNFSFRERVITIYIAGILIDRVIEKKQEKRREAI